MSGVRRLETWLWTGPVGHLIGGGLDFAVALARYARFKVQSRLSARAG